MQSFSDARKDFIYDYLKREDVNWRRLHYQIARLLKKCFSRWIESFISVRRILLSLSEPFVMVAAYGKTLLTAILRMKKDKTRHRYSCYITDTIPRRQVVFWTWFFPFG
ncbi:hypothetical protein [Nitrosomonas sp. Nm34]|uniref:hypothetical protein n=1 Tax=Nitrosomonas sp. Nm34 TaxID=1881055 RepID=UPI0008E7519D|nr:hypothetical protein [Nitrosomonas sp. Nm34]SFI33867.1 hypothetical protein SAMN05428978_100626 [Nitrosomonas sp. Nm34]